MNTVSQDSLRPTNNPGVLLAELAGMAGPAVSGVTLDSRHVRPGDLYVALPGARAHGSEFAAAAVAAGAVAILTDEVGAAACLRTGVPVIVDTAPRVRMAHLAAMVYGRPGDRLKLFGITGTNGKTSTAFLVEAGLQAAGLTVGNLGTVGFRLAGRDLPSSRTTVTTPESPDLQALLAVMAERSADAVVMEVSSHALAFDRVEALEFAVAGFTMLGRDHLDYHRTMDDYFAAKAKLFQPGRARVSVINTDDEWGSRLLGLIRQAGGAAVSTGTGPEATYRLRSWRSDASGVSTVVADLASGTTEFQVSMLGEFNVRNALTAVAMIEQGGTDVAAALPGIAAAQVPGRMQRVGLPGAAPHVVVDFAHTPEAIAAALAALPGRRIAVFGCGGERDAEKRPLMGAAAAAAADIVIITDDNPRGEDPALIRASALAGAQAAQAPRGRATQVLEVGDRAAAIGIALHSAAPGDWVAVLGKGHERGQVVGQGIIPFDDVEAVKAAWNGKGAG